ncbi:hypothetical protein [Enhygromyxa salina]|uniref:hypothetical protein n=1 Tax=Enhygromyxa salina TaxID=215803 RepID=UPI0015E60840|nr:hypothetical protein [Enhygromyxa salina]
MSDHQRGTRRGLVGLTLLLFVGGWGPPTGARVEAPAPPDDPFEAPTPRDPDDAPFMPAPHNQLGQWSAGRERPLTRGFDDDHWVQLTAAPTYAALHVPFIGRGSTPLRGGGATLELDLRVLRWLFVRVYGGHTLHPVFEETTYDEDEGEVVLLANEGVVHATNTGAALVYALDIGRFVPRVDVGAGLLFVRSPPAAQPGQWGAECRQGGVCDLGLSCNAEEICRPTPFPEVHAGIGLDILLGQRWAVGLSVRYYALLQALSQLPVYLHGSARLSVRF